MSSSGWHTHTVCVRLGETVQWSPVLINAADSLHRTEKEIPKFLQTQTTQAAKEILNYMNKAEATVLSSFQIQYRTSITKICGIGIKNKVEDHFIGTENQEVYSHMHC